LPFLTLCCFKSSTSRITAQGALCRHTLFRTTSRQATRDPCVSQSRGRSPEILAPTCDGYWGPCLISSPMTVVLYSPGREDPTTSIADPPGRGPPTPHQQGTPNPKPQVRESRAQPLTLPGRRSHSPFACE